MTTSKQIVKWTLLIIALAAIVWVVIWYANDQAKQKNKELIEVQRDIELSAWLADWQWQAGLADYNVMKGNMRSLQLFGGYFDHLDHLYFREPFHMALAELNSDKSGRKDESAPKLYLSLVNDRFEQDGSSIQKDTHLVTRLMSTSESRSSHISDVVSAVESYHLDGVEIDYENVAANDWPNMALFIEELYNKLHMSGKSLRIVLEPRAPIERIKLPGGPDYVMMAYNLYGTHSGPGPKADRKFIQKLAAKLNHLPGEPVIAFAVGGFDWREDGQITALTEQAALALQKQVKAAPERDKASGSQTFSYTDENNKKHEVWYADAETLSEWIEIAKRTGYYRIAIWRLGDLEQSSLDYFHKL